MNYLTLNFIIILSNIYINWSCLLENKTMPIEVLYFTFLVI